MDLFAFTQMLRRQRWLLGIGALIIVGAVVAFAFEFNDGVRFRVGPQYETQVQLAVVPADYESIVGSVPDPASMAGAASFYATLLASPEAFVQIAEATGARPRGLQVSWTGADGFIVVRAIAGSREDSIRVALASFDWLNDRLDDPLIIARAESNESPEARFDESGNYIGGVRLEASPAFEQASQALWVTVASADDQFSSSLVDASLMPPIYYFSGLRPGQSLRLALETPFGERIDTVDIDIPEPPDQTSPYDLVLRVNHGAVVVPATSAPPGDDDVALAVLVGERISAIWVPVGGDGTAERSVALALLTQDPVAVRTGTRRGPILMMAALVVGLFALLVLAVTVDTWKQGVRFGEDAATRLPDDEDGEDNIPPEQLSGDEASDPEDDHSMWQWENTKKTHPFRYRDSR